MQGKVISSIKCELRWSSSNEIKVVSFKGKSQCLESTSKLKLVGKVFFFSGLLVILGAACDWYCYLMFHT